MHFSSTISTSRNNYNLLNYQKISGNNNIVPLKCRIESSVYTRPTYSWIKGNRVDKITSDNNTLHIQIGGDSNTIKNLNKKHNNKNKKQENNKIKSTKYTIITFFPINLIEQFRRIANFYFLIMTIISILIDSPVSPITSLAPLVFVISVTATKQGYEDYLRHRADNIVNHSLVTVIRNGKEMNIRCENILQGDLVIVSKNCDVPCDLVLLKSSNTNNKCYITTSNLDGETNLKCLRTPNNLPLVSDDNLHTLGIIECEQPKIDLYSFNGKIILSSMYKLITNNLNNDNNTTNNPLIFSTTTTNTNTNNSSNDVIPLIADNLLLRGSRVKNTDWVIGCAVYVGQNTKMALNSRLTRSKIPSSESYINKFLIVILTIQLSLVIFCYIMKRYYDHSVIQKHYFYLINVKNSNIVKNFLQDFLSFLILFNYLIPISLYVTIELHKFLGSFFMEWDRQLYDEVTDQPCIVNTSDLNEELGQVNILFSDKTGTLTKNEMYFQRCSIKGKLYSYKNTKLQDEESGSEIDVNKFNDNVFTFFKALVICHSVQVAIKDENEVPISEQIQSVYTFERIYEENLNVPETETDRVDYVQMKKFNKNSKSQSDNNPLLNKRNLLRNNLKDNKIYPVTETRTADNNNGGGGGGTSENEHSDDNNETRPIEIINKRSRAFNRSTSNIDIPNSVSQQNNRSTHRRTQSYGMPQTFSQTDSVTLSNKNLKRTLSSRESYAQPFYTQKSLLLRSESSKRKKEIKSVVEKLDYQSSSPDEKALIEAAANLGIIYTGDTNDEIKIYVYPPHLNLISPSTMITNPSTLSASSTTSSLLFLTLGKKLTFHRLHTLEFTSDRKRMSVIVRDRKNDIWIFTKGAESHVLPLCSKNVSLNDDMISITNKHVNEFAKYGLRTLVVARRKLTEQEYQSFNDELNLANTSLTDERLQLVANCYENVERDLELLGATAVEDALQDDVSDTLKSLQAAGIKVWVLTGDKCETAYNIAIACGNIDESMNKYFITECTNEIQIREHLRVFEKEIRIATITQRHQRNTTTIKNHISYALIIDGKSLEIALKYAPNDFSTLAIKCDSVICCRLSPLQKCKIVQLIKKTNKKFITAAIGDGANDVSMIQEAHIGLGIFGKEGRQAARCADFSFSKFNMIKKLLLVHGNYHTYRLSMLVLYFFYKNTVFMGLQFLFQFHSMFSTESIYDSLFLTLYNVTYTALPILLLSLTEKPYKEEDLMRKPSLYKKNLFNRLLHWDRFFCWIFFGCYHSFVCFYITYYIWIENNVILTSLPFTAGLSCFGTIAIHNVVVLVNFKLWMEATFQSYIFIITVIGSIVGFMLTTVLYNFINIQYDKDIYGVYNNLLMSTTFWIISILLIVMGLIPDYTMKISKALNLCYNKSIFPGNKNMNTMKNYQNWNNWNNTTTNNNNGIRTTEL